MAHSTGFTKQQQQEILDLHSRHIGPIEIARQMMLGDPMSVVTFLRESGVKLTPRRRGGARKLTDAEEAELCSMYQQGIVMRRLSEKYGISIAGVASILRRREIERRKRRTSGFSDTDCETAYTYYVSGEKMVQIATWFNCTITTVRDMIGRHCIKRGLRVPIKWKPRIKEYVPKPGTRRRFKKAS